ncbi:hypothetical protein HaLaN_11875, partial [Haematococcus lacustris]
MTEWGGGQAGAGLWPDGAGHQRQPEPGVTYKHVKWGLRPTGMDLEAAWRMEGILGRGRGPNR